MRQTADGGYIVVGVAQPSGIYLLKTDSLGDTMWSKNYADFPSESRNARAIAIAHDRGFITAGIVHMQAEEYLYLLRTDSLGDSLWALRTTFCPGPAAGSDVTPTRDGGHMVVGGQGVGDTASGPLALRLDSLGGVLWWKMYLLGDHAYAECVDTCPDGGFVLAGYRTSGPGFSDGFMMRIDSLGDTLWTRSFSGPGDETFFSVRCTPDGGFIAGGNTNSNTGGTDKAFLVKTDALGHQVWRRTYGGAANDYCVEARAMPNGSYIFAGVTSSYGAGSYDGWLVNVDSSGSERWRRTFGGEDWDAFAATELTQDSGCICCGYSASFGGGIDIYLVKTDSSGSAAVAYSQKDRQPGEPVPLIRVPGFVAGQLTCQYFQPIAGRARIELFDASGRRLSSVDLGYHSAGWHDLQVPVAPPTGARFLRLLVRDQNATAKFIVP